LFTHRDDVAFVYAVETLRIVTEHFTFEIIVRSLRTFKWSRSPPNCLRSGSRRQFDIMHYAGIRICKLSLFLFNRVPYIAEWIVK
jgi:hypothetical protein